MATLLKGDKQMETFQVELKVYFQIEEEPARVNPKSRVSPCWMT